MKKLISTISATAMVLIAAVPLANVAYANSSTNDSAYVFTVANNASSNTFRYRFVLLDTDSESEASRFFVIASANYGAGPIHNAGDNSFSWDPTDADTLSGYLNQTWFNTDGSAATTTVLPTGTGSSAAVYTLIPEVKSYIDQNHEWAMPGYDELTTAEKTTITCPITVLSRDEHETHKEKIGFVGDTAANHSNQNWLLRSPQKTDLSAGLYISKDTGNRGAATITGTYRFRPCFWLGVDFFKNVKLDLANTGEKVIDALKENYTRYELETAGYTDDELDSIYATPDEELNVPVLPELSRVGIRAEPDDPQAVDMLDDIGINTIRYALNWHKFETGTDKWDTAYIENRLALIKNKNINSAVGIGVNNNLYSGTSDIRTGIISKSNLDAFKRYCSKLAQYLSANHPKIKTFLIWNEPNNTAFWHGSRPNPTSYFNMVKEASMAFKEYIPDATIVAGVASVPSLLYLDQLFECGIYQYADVISFQPYVAPSNADYGTYEYRLRGMNDVLSRHGGWKDAYISEIGWFSAGSSAAANASEENQAANIIKAIVLADDNDMSGINLYELIDGAGHETLTENNYGLATYDYRKKLGYHALKQYQDMISGADYVGKITSADQKSFAYVYHKNTRIIAMAWTMNDQSVPLSSLGFTGNETAYDLYGEAIASPALSNDPIYIIANANALYSALSNSISSYYGKIPAGYRTSALDALEGATPKTMSAAEIRSACESNYEIAKSIISSARSDESDTSERFAAAYQLHKAALKWSILYKYKHAGTGVPGSLSSDTGIAGLESELNALSDGGSLPFSEAILKQAKKYNGYAHTIMNSAYSGPIKGSSVTIYDLISSRLADLAETAAGIETADNNRDILFLTSPFMIESAGTHELTATIENKTGSAINGVLKLENRSGATVYESNISIAAGAVVQKTINVDIPTSDMTGQYFYRLKLMSGNTLISSHSILVDTQIGPYSDSTIENSYQVESTPAENIFVVNGKKYILLDTTDDKSSQFFVMEENVTKSDYYDGDTYDIKFDTEDSNNIAYYLNNRYTVDPDIRRYIDTEHEWLTEAGSADSKCPTDYIVKCGLSLLSVQEWNDYAGKFGYKPQNQGITWWMRTPGANINTVRYVSHTSGKSIHAIPSKDKRGIRPVYYLDRDFFKEVQPDSLGKNVADAIANVYSSSELICSGTYTKSDLIRLGIYDDEYILFSDVSLTRTGQSGEALTSCGGMKEISLTLTPNKIADHKAILALFDGSGRLLTYDIKTPTDVITLKITLDAPAPENAFAKCFFWNLDTLVAADKCMMID
ncbi:MAG: hypothetical protein IJH37_05800 [Clostridia bacterium]|nr:hypothetical protein [Clostridia bacterium]